MIRIDPTHEHDQTDRKPVRKLKLFPQCLIVNTEPPEIIFCALTLSICSHWNLPDDQQSKGNNPEHILVHLVLGSN